MNKISEILFGIAAFLVGVFKLCAYLELISYIGYLNMEKVLFITVFSDAAFLALVISVIILGERKRL